MSLIMTANEMREYLKKEYGIYSDKELLDEIKKMKPLNIGIFISGKELKDDTKARSIDSCNIYHSHVCLNDGC